MDMMKVEKINQVLADYFEKNKNISQIPAKDLMNEFVKAGIFKSDSNNRPGLPIRKLLRELDENKQLNLIPYVVVERKPVNRRWYFSPIK